MKTSIKSSENLRFLVFTILFIAALVNLGTHVANAQPKRIKNIVLVHGAFADGSGWKPVYDILVNKGYHVNIVQNPLTSLKADVNATNGVIDRQDGKVILVGHSWGGTVITEAGVNDKVAALVYVAAFMPDKGETPENGLPPHRHRQKLDLLHRTSLVLFTLIPLNFTVASLPT